LITLNALCNPLSFIQWWVKLFELNGPMLYIPLGLLTDMPKLWRNFRKLIGEIPKIPEEIPEIFGIFLA